MAITKPSADMLAGYFPVSRIVGKKVARSEVSTAAQMTNSASEPTTGFRKTMFIPESGIAFLTWSTDLSHKGISAGSPAYDPPLNVAGQGRMPDGSYYPIGIAGWAAYRRATTEAGLTDAFALIAPSLAAGQLPTPMAHYKTIGSARVPFAVDAGYFYQFTMYMTAHTDAGSVAHTDGVAQLTTGGGINFLQIEYEPGATIEA